MVRMNFIFIFISSSDTNLLRKKYVKQKNKKHGLTEIHVHVYILSEIHPACHNGVSGIKPESILRHAAEISKTACLVIN